MTIYSSWHRASTEPFQTNAYYKAVCDAYLPYFVAVWYLAF